MDILELFTRSNSCKNFSPELIEVDLLKRVAHLGLSAIDLRHVDAIRILLVTSPNWLDKIHMAFPHGWFTEAPHVLAIIESTDKRNPRFHDSWSPIEIDVGKMIGRMELFLSSEGLAFSTVYDFDPEVIHKSFGLGAEERFLALMALGKTLDFGTTGNLGLDEVRFDIGKNKVISL